MLFRFPLLMTLLILFLLGPGCKTTPTGKSILTVALAQRPASLGLVGDAADVETTAEGGVVLMGGSTDVDGAFRWMLARSGGGDVVVIRASGTAAYNPYIAALGKVNSVETLKIDSRALADNDTVAAIIRQAEMLFIAGGDQSNYMRYWKGTKTADAINYLLKKKKVPVGGTSAGCAILGGYYFSGENGSAVSAEALQDPFRKDVTVYKHDFLDPPFLRRVVTDQHYVARNREGRSLVFLARILNDWKKVASLIAVDERTAVCIDSKGMATVFGGAGQNRPFNNAYFIRFNKKPERLEKGKPLTWNHNQQAVEVYAIKASAEGAGLFNVARFSPADAQGGQHWWWWVENGVLHKKERLRAP